ncbi:hypothetical protein FPV67DRAFT_1455109 [Lyophyllum atratum]|nr:hypothetical protein FPV67DRAFT_1455109 [Lyophyllum atratum]
MPKVWGVLVRGNTRKAVTPPDNLTIVNVALGPKPEKPFDRTCLMMAYPDDQDSAGVVTLAICTLDTRVSECYSTCIAVEGGVEYVFVADGPNDIHIFFNGSGTTSDTPLNHPTESAPIISPACTRPFSTIAEEKSSSASRPHKRAKAESSKGESSWNAENKGKAKEKDKTQENQKPKKDHVRRSSAFPSLALTNASGQVAATQSASPFAIPKTPPTPANASGQATVAQSASPFAISKTPPPACVTFEDDTIGEGVEVRKGSQVKFWHVITSNGKELARLIDGKPQGSTVGQDTFIKGFDQGIIGMKPGGVRRIVIPVSIYGKGRIPGAVNDVFVVAVAIL